MGSASWWICGEGQKTGFFLDQRENRLAACAYASGRVLDCFTNTGAFALQFARHCESVLGVDVSAESVRTGPPQLRAKWIQQRRIRREQRF